MIENPEKLADRLAVEGQKCLDYFKSLPPADWKVKLYTDGSQWDIQDLLAHFVSAEQANQHLVNYIMAGGEGAPVDFNINVFNEKDVERLCLLPIGELLQNFSSLRQSLVNLVLQMRNEDLIKTGYHPFLGFATVADIIKLVYRHNQIHIRDVKRILN